MDEILTSNSVFIVQNWIKIGQYSFVYLENI